MTTLVSSLHTFILVTICCIFFEEGNGFPPSPKTFIPDIVKNKRRSSRLFMGWLDNFLPKPYDANDNDDGSTRQQQYPEQYPASYTLSNMTLPSDSDSDELVHIIRPLLLNTQLQSRPLQLAYDANVHGWNAQSFHDKVDGCGAAIVLAKTKGSREKQIYVGGYNPKGWASMGGARPSVAAFLFYSSSSLLSSGKELKLQKLRKVGGGGLAISTDDPNYGISFGPDGLVLSLQSPRQCVATSKLGTYYERGPDQYSSLFDVVDGNTMSKEVDSLKVYVGVYQDDEEIPYSGAVLDMTSG